MAKVLCCLLLLPCALASVTIPTNQLFQNTLRRWNIRPLNDKDRSERWSRFIRAKEMVEQTTSDIVLGSLNQFTVLNDEEYDILVRPLFEGRYNFTDLVVPQVDEDHPILRKHNRNKRAMPATYTYWEDTIGLTPAGNQKSCGSCWSFPNTGAIEALYKKLSGEHIRFSEQYFVDCSFVFSGCSGGTANDGFKLTLMRQFMLTATEWPYTAYYKACKFTDRIATRQGNAMTKIWLQDWYPLGKNEAGLLGGLQYSPVSFGSYIGSRALFAYSGGTYDDATCVTDPAPHSMLLVGYTETILRVKASYGATWGDKGYVNYKRGSGNLVSCNFYKNGYFILATHQREMQYEWCSERSVVTREVCLASCTAMNTAEVTGWTLAVIPTKMHNQQIYEIAEAAYPGKKGDDKFNFLWMGLLDLEKNELFTWIDDYTPVNYFNNTKGANYGKLWGVINKNTGNWLMKSSKTATFRGLCGRAVTCRDISTAVPNGGVTYDRADLTEGTVATAKCDSKDATISGESILTCAGGRWNHDIPTCASGVATCAKPNIKDGTVSPDSATINSGAKYTVTCAADFTISGSDKVTCTNGKLSKLPTCVQAQPQPCNKPTIQDGSVSPDSSTIVSGADYTASCDSGFTMTGTATVTCTNGVLSDLPTCAAADTKCAAPTVPHGTVTPSGPILVGSSYTVTCVDGYTLEVAGSGTVTCSKKKGKGVLSALPTCQEVPLPSCAKPTVTKGEVSPSDEKVAVGGVYTVTCNEHYFITGSEEMTCSLKKKKATLSKAPTCTEETCEPNKAVITDGTITEGESSRYVFGDNVKYECNDNFVMEGNKRIQCRGKWWSSRVPTCIAVNTNCAEFTVAKGNLGNLHPYFTDDTVSVTCKTDYILKGENPIRVCETAGWKSDAPTCSKNAGGQCISLTAPKNGVMTCSGATGGNNVASTACSTSCKAGYIVLLGAVQETECQVKKRKFTWKSLQTKSNPLAEFAPCIEIIVPAEKKLKSKVVLSTKYCENSKEVGLITTAVKTFLKDDLQIPCLGNNKCEVETVECTYRVKTQDVQLIFVIKQTQELLDNSLLNAAKNKIKTSVKGNAFTLSIADGAARRKKRATTLSADADSLVSEDQVTCGQGEVTENGVCVKCPAGYKTVAGACVACPTGSYNAAEGAIECIACENAKTTYGEGSTKADQCYELCTVPEIAGGSVNQEAGFKVEPAYTLTLTCDDTYSASVTEFVCSSYAADQHKCSPLSQCKSSLISVEHGAFSGATAPYDTGETVTFTCNDGYKLIGDKVLTCVDRVWSNASPLCKAVNTKCTAYKVTSGVISDDSSTFITDESVSVTCNYGYELSGTNPRVCTAGTGWKTDAQTCVKNEGKCVRLTAPDDGTLSCTGSRGIKSTCTLTCTSGYISLGQEKTVTCYDTLLWSHQSYTNSQGDFAPCAQEQTPNTRVLSAELYLAQDYCKTAQEKDAVVKAFDAYIASAAAAVPCFTASKCAVENTACSNEGGSSKITFKLSQTTELSDATVLSTSDTRINTLVETKAMSFDVTTSKKRATTTFIAESGSYTGNIETTCSGGFAQGFDTCLTCPAGYHIPAGNSPVCTPCAVGTYSTTTGATSCQTCSGGLTTYGTGSTSSDDCLDLCKVPGVTHGTLSPPTGYNVAPNTLVSLICSIGYAGTQDTFVCNSGTAPRCTQVEGEKEKEVTGGGGGSSTTVIVVVIVVVLLVFVIGAAAIFWVKKRGQLIVRTRDTDTSTVLANKTSDANGLGHDNVADEGGNLYDTGI